MAGKRKYFSTEFKTKVALEAARGELTSAELVAQYGVYQAVFVVHTSISALRVPAPPLQLLGEAPYYMALPAGC